MKPTKRQEIITFKVDESLREAMKAIPNRSEFIRAAILSALDSVCPLCMGTGILTPDQRKHWDRFRENHTITECNDCHAIHIRCAGDKRKIDKVHHNGAEENA